MVTVEEVRKAQRAEGPATIMAIGTANPSNCVDQSTYPDFYFRVTNSEHKTELKEKFQRMCEKSMIKKRYMYLNEEILKENPNICAYMAPSLDARQDMVVVEVPRLGKEAAVESQISTTATKTDDTKSESVGSRRSRPRQVNEFGTDCAELSNTRERRV